MIRVIPAIGINRMFWEDSIGINVISVSRWSLSLALLLRPSYFENKFKFTVVALRGLIFLLLIVTMTRGILLPLSLIFFYVGIFVPIK